jgi:hypothetical protein
MPGGRLRNAEGRGNVLWTMHASNKPGDPRSLGRDGVDAALAAVVQGMWSGALGHTVRCVPTRRTVVAWHDGVHWFGKLRCGEGRRARAEWRWLHVLPLLGVPVPEPVAFVGRGARSLLVTRALPGRALDVWAVVARDEGWLAQLARYAAAHLAPLVRRLHDQGLAFRDLYCNHVFAEDPRAPSPSSPALLDVERVFAPWFRRQRWLVKDLAGLWASVPCAVPPRAGLRFLRAYLGESLTERRSLLAAIDRKAARIRAHTPRFG